MRCILLLLTHLSISCAREIEHFMIDISTETPAGCLCQLANPITKEVVFEKFQVVDSSNIEAMQALDAFHRDFPNNLPISKLISRAIYDFQDGISKVIDITQACNEWISLVEIDILEYGNINRIFSHPDLIPTSERNRSEQNEL